LAGADGVHVGQDDLDMAEARRITGPTLLIGRSTHDMAQVRRAIEENADYIAVGPMFDSKTKSRPTIAGPAPARPAPSLTDRPLVAIGGITTERLPELLRTGVRCVAVCHAIIAAEYPARACRQLSSLLS